MTDLLRIGLSALLAQQRALATTSNNIANASTPGYSRQRIELIERPVERLGNQMIGTGVQIGLNRRLTDDILADQLRTASSGFSRAESFAGLAGAIDDLLADSQTGLSATMQAFTGALQNVSNDPSSASSRQVLLSESRNVIARFEAMDRRLDEIGDEVRSRLAATTAEINSIGAGLASVNKQLIDAGAATGRVPPPDLLDQRDRLLERLSELVQVDSVQQSDGTTSVFIGSGQALVIGADAAQLAVTPGTTDQSQPRVVLRNGGPDIEITPFLGGGEIGGLLDFNREMLAPTRSELGRIAVGLVNTVNTAHRNGMDAEGQLGGDFFAIGAPQTFPATTNTGTGSVAVTITGVSALQPTNYRLTFDGAAYTLQRADNGAVVPMTGAGTTASPFVADGLSIVVSGAPAANDQFLVKPLEDLAGTMTLVVTQAADIAAAAPTRTSAAVTNVGTGQISAGAVTDVTNAPLLTTSTIEFIDASTYSINGAGSFAYAPGADIDVNGTRVQITGAPAAGDQFVIQANAGGTGDNRNVKAMIDRLGQPVFDGGVTLPAAVSSFITNAGARTAEASNQRDAQQFLLDQNRDRLDSVRGVNLDEEAADMLRFEQLYQAAAQTMAVASTMFDTLLAALRR